VASYLFSFKVVKGERYQRCIVHLLVYLLIICSKSCDWRAAEPFATTIPLAFGRLPWQGLLHLFASHQRWILIIRGWILSQLNCWQVWQQGLECGLLCFALLVFCLSPCGYRQFLAGNCPCERNGGICLDLASGTGFGSLLNSHGRVQTLLLLQCVSLLALGAF